MNITPVIAILIVVSVAVATDVRQRRIYNALTVPAMVFGLSLRAATDGTTGLLSAVAGLLLGAALFTIPVVFLGRGAGDLKLLAALGAIGGPGFVVWCALLTGAAGAAFAVIVLLSRRRFGMVVGGMALDMISGQMPAAASNIRLPYAVPIALGAVATIALR
jgi:prepilin peptidase CpaA